MIVTPAYRPYSGPSRTGQGNLSSPAPLPDGASSTKRSIYEACPDKKLPVDYTGDDDVFDSTFGQTSSTLPISTHKRHRTSSTRIDETQRELEIKAKMIGLDKELAEQNNAHRENENEYTKACAADVAAQEAAKAAAAEKGRALRKQTLSLEALRPLQDKKTKMADLIKRRKELKEAMETVDNEILKM